MKGKFGTIWRVAIAMVLAVSLGLVTAAPVAAGPPGATLTSPGAGIDSISGTPTDSGTEAGVHTIVVTDAAASTLLGTDAESDTTADTMAVGLGGTETLSLTIAGESITTAALAVAVAHSTTLAFVANDIQTKINAQTSNADVTVSVAGSSPTKYFVITVNEAGLANSITTQVTGNGATPTGLGGQSPVAGTDAKAVDTFAAATGSNGSWVNENPGSTKTVTDTTSAGTASSLAGLESLVETAGAFINGVTLDASAALTAGTAVVTVSAGTAAYFGVAGTGTMTAGDSNELTITAFDDAWNRATGYAGSKSLTFSGLATAPDATVPTVEGTNVGTATAVNFIAGVSASNAATLVAYCAEATWVDASDGGITSSPGHGQPLTVYPDVVATLTVEVQPMAAVAGVTIAPDVQVKAVDEYGNPITGEGMSVSKIAGTGTLSGTSLQWTDLSGIATFDDLSINLIGADKQLRFTMSAVTVDSGIFAITAAAVDTLTVEVQPTATVAGVAITPAVQVKAVDAYSNVIEGESIAASLQAGTGTLSGTTPQVTNASGIATFGDLSIDLIGADKQLRFTAGGKNVDSDVFAITPAAFAGYTVVPAAGPYEAGTNFGVTITAVDGFDNPVGAAYITDEPYTWVTTASNAPDTTSPVIGTLAAVDFTDGVATMSVTLYAAESGVTFTVTDNSTATGTSAGITVDPDAVAVLTVEEQPTATAAGASITPSVEVKAVDEYGNVIEGESIAVSKIAGAGALSGHTTQVTDAAGIATFNDLSIDLVGADKQLQFTAGAATVDSDVFAITSGAVATLTVVAEPTNTDAGVAIGPVTVLAEDAFSNPVEGVSIAVTEVGAYTFDAGTLSQATGVDGIATFDDLVINTADTGYQLHFSYVATTTSALFDVLPGQAASFVFGAISTQDAGVAFPITITAVDTYGNTDTSYTGTATLTDLTGTIDPGVTGAFTGGVWADNVTILLLYTGNTITATDALVTGTSDPFDVDPYPVYNTTTGQGYLTIQAAIDDASSGNTITVSPGTYVEDITISEDLTLVSSGGPAVTKLTGTGAAPVIVIGDYNVTVDGFEIDPGTDGISIDTISAGNVVTIQNEVIHGNSDSGIDVGTVLGTLNVTDCIIADNSSDGVYIDLVDDGGTVVMTGNIIGAWDDGTTSFSGNGDEGIYLYEVLDGSTVTIGGPTSAEANIICDNGDTGIYLYEFYYGSAVAIEGNVIGSYAAPGSALDGNNYGIYVYYVDFGSTLTITGNTINENYYEGIYVYEVGWDGSTPATAAEYYAEFLTYGANTVTIEVNTITGNGVSPSYDGIYISDVDFATYVTIQNNNVSKNGYAGIDLEYHGTDGDDFYLDDDTVDVRPDPAYPAYFGPVVLVKGNTITDNEEYGIYQYDDWEYGTIVTIEDNLISGNGYAGIYFDYDIENDGHAIIRGNTIVSNGIDGWYGGIYVEEYVEYRGTCTVEDNFIAGNFGTGVYVYEVEYDGTVTIRGNTIGSGTDAQGDVYAGNESEGIYVDYVYDATVEIARNDISKNEGDGIYFYEVDDETASVSVTCNSIRDNDGYGLGIDYLYDGDVDAHYNNIAGNSSGGIDNDYVDIVLDATHNWWGDTSGPSDYGPGSGDGVSDYVLFSPWLTSPSVCQVRTTLAAGWNTLSTPIALDSAADELAELGLDMVQAYGFSGGIWVPITTANDNLEPCSAFYVNMNSSAKIEFTPSAEITDPQSKSLPAGWSLVSMANLGSMAADDALQTAFLVPGDLTGYAQVVSPAVNQPSWAFLRGGSSPPDMVPCKGYWLFMNNAGTLAGITSTPIDLH